MIIQVVAEVAAGDSLVARKLTAISRRTDYNKPDELKGFLLGYMSQEIGVEVQEIDVRANGKDYWKKFTRK